MAQALSTIGTAQLPRQWAGENLMNVSYGAILGDSTAWHRCAIIWDADGLPDSAFHLQMFLDGNRVGTPNFCGASNDRDTTEFPAPIGNLYVIYNQNVQTGKSASIDDMKIWNYANASFSDSL